jgi:hypothetical protein
MIRHRNKISNNRSRRLKISLIKMASNSRQIQNRRLHLPTRKVKRKSNHNLARVKSQKRAKKGVAYLAISGVTLSQKTK